MVKLSYITADSKIYPILFIFLFIHLSFYKYSICHWLYHKILFSKAHVSAVGGDYTNLSSMWMHANGALFPLVISYLYILLFFKNSIGFSSFLFIRLEWNILFPHLFCPFKVWKYCNNINTGYCEIEEKYACLSDFG